MHWRSSSQRSTHSWDPSSWCSAEFEPEQTAKPKESILTYLETKSKNSWERGHFEVQLASFLQLGAPFGERHRPVSATFHSSHRWPSTTFRFLPANISLTDIAFTRLIHRLLARSAGSLSTWTLPSTMDRLELLVWERGTNSDCFAFWDRLEKNACEFKNGSVLKNQLAICAPSSPCSSLFSPQWCHMVTESGHKLWNWFCGNTYIKAQTDPFAFFWFCFSTTSQKTKAFRASQNSKQHTKSQFDSPLWKIPASIKDRFFGTGSRTNVSLASLNC